MPLMGLKARAAPGEGRIEIRNVNVPDYRGRVDAGKYADMKRALLAVLPGGDLGLTQTEMFEAVKPHLSQKLFPGGATSGWWAKAVQLDLEARGIVVRDASSKPLRWRRTE
jgi:hypothetical protein